MREFQREETEEQGPDLAQPNCSEVSRQTSVV